MKENVFHTCVNHRSWRFIDNRSSLASAMAWRHAGTKPLPKPTMMRITDAALRHRCNMTLHDDFIKWKHFPRYWLRSGVRWVQDDYIWNRYQIRSRHFMHHHHRLIRRMLSLWQPTMVIKQSISRPFGFIIRVRVIIYYTGLQSPYVTKHYRPHRITTHVCMCVHICIITHIVWDHFIGLMLANTKSISHRRFELWSIYPYIDWASEVFPIPCHKPK